MLETFQLEVPLAVPLAPVALLRQVTLVTPTSSDALPLTARDAEDVAKFADDVGDTMVIVGDI
jgi:hypothetical protein